MAAILPGAADITEYWENILTGKDCITDIPDNYWSIDDFYDPDPAAEDKTYAYKAGVVDSIEFDAISYGIPPSVMESISVEQLYALVVAKKALLDAGLIGRGAKPFNKEKTGVVLAAGTGKSVYSLARRQDMVKTKQVLLNCGVDEALAERVITRLKDAELEWNESSEPGYLANVTAGRIANRFDLGGTNCAVDAACASSLAALKIAIGELERGDCDIMLTGGVNLDLTSTTFVSFCKTPALSQHNVSRPFDADSDGMILGDGVAMVVLKRLEDAERDHDRIYAVIKAVGSSSDGRDTSIFAPSPRGQMSAIERAYDMAGVDPAGTALIEAHGTGTYAGDGCEITALNRLYEHDGVKPRSIVIGSVKSQIGHTRMAAGIAGLMKAALALYHRTLPPTINVKKERPEFVGSPFHTICSPKPWITNRTAPVRRAGLSSFGFGGANFHAVLQEYASDPHAWARLNRVPEGICFSAVDREGLVSLCQEWIDKMSADPMAYDALLDEQLDPGALPMDRPRLGFVGRDCPDTIAKLRVAVAKLSAYDEPVSEEFRVGRDTVWYRAAGIAADAKVATLFSSQSAQYQGMLSEIAQDYPEMSDYLARIGSALEARGLTPIAQMIYADEPSAELTNTVYSQSALAAVCGGLYDIMKNRCYSDDIVIGHSFGEITGLWAAGAIDAQTFADMTVERGVAMASARAGTGMLVVAASAEACQGWITAYEHVYIANENSLDQTLVSGDLGELKSLASELMSANVACSVLNVSHGFHCPFMKEPNVLFGKDLGDIEFKPLTKTLYSGASGKPYGRQASSMRTTVERQMEQPVRFMQCVLDAYEAGVRVFVEVGPGKVLTNLVRRILPDKQIDTVAVNGDRDCSPSQYQLEEALVHLRVLGLPLSGDPYRLRSSEVIRDDKPRSAYVIDPIQYMTPKKKEIVDQAMNTVDSVGTVDSRRDSSTMKGQEAMDANALDMVYGIQSLNGQALEKFLASQEQQIAVFSQLMQDSGGSPDVVKMMEAFQDNSMRAYDEYMTGQREILGGGDGAISSELTARPVAEPVPHTWSVPVAQPVRMRADVHEEKAPHTSSEAPDLHKRESDNTTVAPEEHEAAQADAAQGADFDPVEMIINIISDKTGYPEDMVDADMNIESDLGIDSIKRIEVFAELSNRLPNKLEADDVEAIAMLHTISEIGDYIKKKFTEVNTEVSTGGNTGENAGVSTRGSTEGNEAGNADEPPADSPVIKRFEVGVRQARAEERTATLLDSGIVIVVQDDSGVAECVSSRLSRRGYTTRLVALPAADEAAVEQVFADACADINQPLAGFVYVGSNEDPGSLFPKDEVDALKSVFLCAKYFTRSFTGGAGNGFFISAARMDGHLGLSAGDRIVQGGLFGLHKSLTVEWHDLPLNTHAIISKAIDLAQDLPPEAAADYLMEEIFTYGNDAGVGRTSDGRRFETHLTENYPDPDSRTQGPGPDDVVLVTGGGRGITAQCVIRLAQASHCGFVLLGRTDITMDIDWAQGERDRAKLRDLAIAKLHLAKPKPTEIEALVDSALNQMEISDTLRAIDSAGGRAHYVSCDVRDAERLAQVLRDEQAQLGSITGLVHGAGTIADKTIQRKTVADFDNVFASKVLGLDACLSSLDTSKLKYIVMFSSTSAYFGNGGQTDYSMANEVLNKFAFCFKRTHRACTTVAVNWGLWDGGSMASDSIRNAVKDSEIVLIPIEVGARYFVDQFMYAQKPDVCQIVINRSSEMLRPKTDLS